MAKVRFFLFIGWMVGLTGATKAQDDAGIAQIVNSKNDSLFKNNRDYVTYALKYRKLMQANAGRDGTRDSLAGVVAKSDLTESEQSILGNLILLSGNDVSGDVYVQVKVLEQELTSKFNRTVALTWLYYRDNYYAGMAKEFNTWALKIRKFIHQSIGYYDAHGNIVNDSAFMTEIQLYELKVGDCIADIGAGSGYFEILLSRYGDNLQAYAVDIDSRATAQLTTQLQFLDLNDGKNISYHAVLGNEKSSTLPSNTFDKVMIRNTFHHFTYPNKMLDDCKRIMKKNARLFIADILVDETDQLPACRLHLTRSVFLKYLTDSGFALIEETNLDYDHFKLFEFHRVP